MRGLRRKVYNGFMSMAAKNESLKGIQEAELTERLAFCHPLAGRLFSANAFIDILLPIGVLVFAVLALAWRLFVADSASSSFWEHFDKQSLELAFLLSPFLIAAIWRTIHKLRLALGPGISIVAPSRPLKFGESFSIACIRFGRMKRFDHQTVSLVNTLEIHHPGKVANPHVYDGKNPDMFGYVTEKEGFRQILAKDGDLDLAGPVFLSCRIPCLHDGLIDNARWAIRVECEKGGRTVFQEQTPLNVDFLAD